jgi:hypothetical protein
MKRKDYEKPTMDVVEVKQQQQLLAGSGGASRDDYGDAIPGDWSGNAPMLIPGIDNNILFE